MEVDKLSKAKIKKEGDGDGELCLGAVIWNSFSTVDRSHLQSSREKIPD
jgi:hypothetical protein